MPRGPSKTGREPRAGVKDTQMLMTTRWPLRRRGVNNKQGEPNSFSPNTASLTRTIALQVSLGNYTSGDLSIPVQWHQSTAPCPAPTASTSLSLSSSDALSDSWQSLPAMGSQRRKPPSRSQPQNESPKAVLTPSSLATLKTKIHCISEP